MKKIIITLISLSIVAVSCKNEPKTATPPALTSGDLNSTETTEKVSFNNPKNTVLFENYLAVKAAMVNTNSATTEEAAKQMANQFKNAPEYAAIQQIASLIASTSDMEKQREFFVGLTNETTKILSQDIASGNLIQQYCPMAFDGKGGYWLSNSKEIRNPYFGDVMLACGEVSKVME